MSGNQENFDRAEIEWNLDQLYGDLAIAKDKISFNLHYSKELTETEKLHLRGLLCGYSPTEIATKLFKKSKECKSIFVKQFINMSKN
jgi:hypothetical protein